MKITAIFCGRPNGQSIRMARVALKGAKEAGADEVQLINLNALTIKPCIDCKACVRRLNDPDFDGGCPLNDDMDWLDEQYLSSDAVIYVAPMYENFVPGPYKNMCDRLGPSHDVTFQKFAYDNQIAKGRTPKIDPRFFKVRPVVYIGHGGTEWNYLSYPTLSIPSISLGLQVVDYVSIEWSNGWLQDGRAQRIQEAGAHLARMAALPPEERRFIGDPGHCPVCHNRVMRLGDRTDEVVCALCGTVGTLSVEDGKIRVSYTPEALAISHVLDGGRMQHLKDLQENGKKYATVDYSVSDTIAKELAAEIPVCKPEKK